MEEDVIKIDELEYFNPFKTIDSQLNASLTLSVSSCNLSFQQRKFLQLAYSDNIEELTKSDLPDDDLPDDDIFNLKREFYRTHYVRAFYENRQLTDEDIIKLNSRIKKVKQVIDDCKTLTPYNSISDISTMFQVYTILEDKQDKILGVWKDIFKFNNDVEIFNFQGCLGLLILNEFCFCYRKKQIDMCIIYATLSTDLSFHLPFSFKWETEMLNDLRDKFKKEYNTKKKLSNAGKKSSQKRGEPRENGYSIWKNNKLFEYIPAVALDKFKEIYKNQYTNYPPADGDTIKNSWFRYYRKKLIKASSIHKAELDKDR